MEKNQFGENMLIGNDGKSYSSPEELSRANAIFENREYVQKSQLIGRDGKVYSSPEELFRADAKFENRQAVMDNLSMIQMLEQLRRDINADIEKRKIAYIGQDGRDYFDKESLDLANKEYIEKIYKFIGKDGKDYSTSEELEVANKRYNDMMFPREENKLLYPEPIPREQIYYDDLDTSHKRR